MGHLPSRKPAGPGSCSPDPKETTGTKLSGKGPGIRAESSLQLASSEALFLQVCSPTRRTVAAQGSLARNAGSQAPPWTPQSSMCVLTRHMVICGSSPPSGLGGNRQRPDSPQVGTLGAPPNLKPPALKKPRGLSPLPHSCCPTQQATGQLSPSSRLPREEGAPAC